MRRRLLQKNVLPFRPLSNSTVEVIETMSFAFRFDMVDQDISIILFSGRTSLPLTTKGDMVAN